MLWAWRRLLRLICCGADEVEECDAYAEVAGPKFDGQKLYSHSLTALASTTSQCPAPEIFLNKYHKVITHDVTAKQAVCITSDIAVLGNADLSGGDTCITGNVLVAGDVVVLGSPCVTGTVIILGSARVEGQVCVTGDCFIQGDLAVKGKLKVDGKLCVFGSKDIQPA